MTMWEKQISVWATGIQKESWGVVGHFLEIIKQHLLFLKAVKYKAMYGVFIRIEALLSLKNA